MRQRATLTDRVSDGAFRFLMRIALSMPYNARVAFMGAVMGRFLGPLAGYPARIRKNLSETLPELSKQEVRRIKNGSLNNMGRTIAEIYSGSEFADRCAGMKISGGGLPHLEAANKSKQPVVLITGHIGNYDAARAALIARGFDIAALYRPMNNMLFNEHYADAISKIGPTFPIGKRGMTGLLRHLKHGGMAAFLVDLAMRQGVELQYFGRPALTSTSPAEIASRYDALLIPAYGLRREDGLSFDIIVEDPIPHTDPVTMTQALNDSLEALARKNLSQMLWSHRRWKTRRTSHVSKQVQRAHSAD